MYIHKYINMYIHKYIYIKHDNIQRQPKIQMRFLPSILRYNQFLYIPYKTIKVKNKNRLQLKIKTETVFITIFVDVNI